MITRVVKLSSDDIDKDLIKDAAKIILDGGLVVFPTETVYGLGADATSAEAATKIYAAKGRPSDNPLIIHISTPEDAEDYTYTSPLYYKLAKEFMPGPITVILPAKNSVPRETRGGLDTVAVRCPENPIANALIRAVGRPIAAPSANLSGSPSPTNAEHVIDDMYGRCDMIIDGGDSDFGLESTIVKIDGENSVTLLRPGKITVDDIKKLGVEVEIASAVKSDLKAGEIALSPGMKYKHYAPKTELFLLDGEASSRVEYILNDDPHLTAVICYSDEVDLFPNYKVIDFGAKTDYITQAHLLFKVLRDLDKENYTRIYAPLPSAEGVGLALYNRMIRAAAHKIIKL